MQNDRPNRCTGCGKIVLKIETEKAPETSPKSNQVESRTAKGDAESDPEVQQQIEQPKGQEYSNAFSLFRQFLQSAPSATSGGNPLVPRLKAETEAGCDLRKKFCVGCLKISQNRYRVNTERKKNIENDPNNYLTTDWSQDHLPPREIFLYDAADQPTPLSSNNLHSLKKPNPNPAPAPAESIPPLPRMSKCTRRFTFDGISPMSSMDSLTDEKARKAKDDSALVEANKNGFVDAWIHRRILTQESAPSDEQTAGLNPMEGRQHPKVPPIRRPPPASHNVSLFDDHIVSPAPSDELNFHATNKEKQVHKSESSEHGDIRGVTTSTEQSTLIPASLNLLNEIDIVPEDSASFEKKAKPSAQSSTQDVKKFDKRDDNNEKDTEKSKSNPCSPLPTFVEDFLHTKKAVSLVGGNDKVKRQALMLTGVGEDEPNPLEGRRLLLEKVGAGRSVAGSDAPSCNNASPTAKSIDPTNDKRCTDDSEEQRQGPPSSSSREEQPSMSSDSLRGRALLLSGAEIPVGENEKQVVVRDYSDDIVADEARNDEALNPRGELDARCESMALFMLCGDLASLMTYR